MIQNSRTLFLSHEDCVGHDVGVGHPESPARLLAIKKRLKTSDCKDLLSFKDAPLLAVNALYGVHPNHHVDELMRLSPEEGLVHLDGDTALNPVSLNAARRGAGAAIYGVEELLADRFDSVFCATRPPGHHAETAIAMGFCIFNNVALAAEKALAMGLRRVAIIDFDVHHGNGTVEIFQNRPEVLVCSSFQYPFYPGRYDRINKKNICLTPLNFGAGSAVFRQKVSKDWLPAIKAHQPELFILSAGFDAHYEDPLGGLSLLDEDYLWVTQLIKDQARQFSGGKILSVLEGGYSLGALARSVEQHLFGLIG